MFEVLFLKCDLPIIHGLRLLRVALLSFGTPQSYHAKDNSSRNYWIVHKIMGGSSRTSIEVVPVLTVSLWVDGLFLDAKA